ncbi:ATP-binding cassette domain-containing protein [Neorhodopirellula pilleata]|uniref:Toxin RTX-I translocation ATP-binding protein n=1 Tax=Neorhodopirellula pilleata TaxID=2714738 RepID=A0A5C6A8C1_9BACT|nr:ABC transporter ATP-binding protein [Neorhodopirellula pilleata]TWT95637.1 Toxin RTX-I translocation ATP-binding protein [Neorhodopirellula pilleata]
MNRFSSLTQPRREAAEHGSGLLWLWATIAGLTVPFLIVLFGVVAELIDQRELTPPSVRLGTNLAVPLPSGFELQDGFAQLAELVILALLLSGIFCLAVWLNRRAADHRTRVVIKSLHKRVLEQSLRRAEVEGAAAQRSRAAQLIGKDLPELGIGLSLWYRVIPRSVLMLFGCVGLALMVNVWLAILAVISGAALWRLYGRLRNPDWLELSRFEIPVIRERLVGLIGDAPMMARLQAGGLADQAFDAELESLDRRVCGDDARRGRLWPLLMFAGSFAIALLVMGLGANILNVSAESLDAGVVVDQGLSLPASLVLGLALTGAAFSAARISELARQLRRSGRACEAVYFYLESNDDVAPSEQRVGLAGLRESVDLQDISLQDASGKPILNNLSLSLQPKSLVGLLGTDEVSTRSLVELLMGFGRPHHGILQIDGIALRDVHPKALANQVMWIAPDGPLWEGTITDNLMAGLDRNVDKRDMVDVLEGLGMYEMITRLSDGLDTIVGSASSLNTNRSSISDTAVRDGLSMNSRYMLGIARALLHRPAIVLANEPPAPTEHLSEDPCLKSLRKLADSGSLVVVLPHRLQTLRHCDRVVLLNGANLVGEGRHTDLLNSSDLYRHLNYLLFNPYRHRSGR